MKEWWDNLALREKQMLLLGFFFISAAIIYFFMWSPLSEKEENLRHQIQRNNELLSWMQETDKQILTIEKKTPIQPSRTKKSLLGFVQENINGSTLKENLTQLHQFETDSVQLVFQKVEFDKLITWLIKMTQQEGLTITQMSVTPSASAGIVQADLVLK